MKVMGFAFFLFNPFADLGDRSQGEKDWRFFEHKGFLLIRPTMRTVDQKGYINVFRTMV